MIRVLQIVKCPVLKACIWIVAWHQQAEDPRSSFNQPRSTTQRVNAGQHIVPERHKLTACCCRQQSLHVAMAAQSKLRRPQDPLLSLFGPWTRLFRSRLKRTSRTSRLVATIVLLLSILSGVYEGKRWLKSRSQRQAHGKKLLRRNSGLRGKDGSRTIFVPYRSSTAEVKIHPTKPTTFDAHRRLFLNPPRAARLGDGHVPPPNVKPGLNIAFIHQFLSLLSIMVPHWNSKESGLLLSQGMFLLLRTYLSLVVTRLDGEIVRDLVAGHGRGFMFGIVKWCGIGGRYTISLHGPC